MRILWFNWRDIRNPAAGGAEVFTHEVLSRLVKRGHSATLFTAAFPHCLAKEAVDGIDIIRMGGKYGVYSAAKKYYERTKDRYDAVVDEINTRPFMTPKFVKEKKLVALFHQLAREFWFYETSFPVNYIGYYFLENMWLANYRDVNVITVSESSKKDLEAMNFNHITMIPEGLSVTPMQEIPEKAIEPTIVFVGRLKKAKLPQHALQAFSIIKKEIPNAKMQVIGDGYLRAELERQYGENGIEFCGYVKSDLKYELLRKAHLILMPAVREGWGLVVTEANACGTPAVAYNVPGVRDSVQDGLTGLLTKENRPAELAQAAIGLLKDEKTLDRLGRSALDYSKKFSWDVTADRFEEILNGVQ